MLSRLKKPSILSAILSAAFLMNGMALFAEDPSVAEDTVRVPAVNFENRTNRRASPAAREYERNTGILGAEEVLKDGEYALRGVSITRVFDPSKEGMGADIVTIDPDADFGHINAIIRVLQGYLSKAFQYDLEDAAVVARYIVYYNARLRNDASLYQDKFSEDVQSRIDANKVGIDRSYRNWSGNTQILIPLKKNIVRPGKTDVDREEITEEETGINEDDKTDMDRIDEERKEEDKDRLEEKEEQLEKKKEDTGKKLEELQKDPEKNKEAIEETKEELEKIEEEQAEVEKQKEELEEGTTTPTDGGEETTDGGEESTETTDGGEETTTDGGEETTDGGEETTDATDGSEETTEEVATNTTDETSKPDETLEEIDKSENVIAEKILFLRILRYIEGGHYSNELWTIDPKKDDTLEKSPYTNICGREFVGVGEESVVVIGYEGSAHNDSGHILVVINAKDLLKKAQSKEEVFWRTPMVSRNGKIYAFIKDGNSYFLGRFNADMTLDAKSSDPISQNSDITFFGEKIYLTGKSGTGDSTTIQVFNSGDLSLLKTITPPAN